ncbi:hypothetical protein [Chitinasiproducens palmae]|uniref:Uncharacterized protein n=1 Tax=Chitinasiproducens palmae TaxID=1770053 RepID=A0A1H2PVD4_9BURK|nr:hypothetical protein [Chitinasiproducens palmae]SDV51260.1 hypothetical protein SAMN05216551_11612 [Chitinasiproducens palmae]
MESSAVGSVAWLYGLAQVKGGVRRRDLANAIQAARNAPSEAAGWSGPSDGADAADAMRQIDYLAGIAIVQHAGRLAHKHALLRELAVRVASPNVAPRMTDAPADAAAHSGACAAASSRTHSATHSATHSGARPKADSEARAAAHATPRAHDDEWLRAPLAGRAAATVSCPTLDRMGALAQDAGDAALQASLRFEHFPIKPTTPMASGSTSLATSTSTLPDSASAAPSGASSYTTAPAAGSACDKVIVADKPGARPRASERRAGVDCAPQDEGETSTIRRLSDRLLTALGIGRRRTAFDREERRCRGLSWNKVDFETLTSDASVRTRGLGSRTEASDADVNTDSNTDGNADAGADDTAVGTSASGVSADGHPYDPARSAASAASAAGHVTRHSVNTNPAMPSMRGETDATGASRDAKRVDATGAAAVMDATMGAAMDASRRHALGDEPPAPAQALSPWLTASPDAKLNARVAEALRQLDEACRTPSPPPRRRPRIARSRERLI